MQSVAIDVGSTHIKGALLDSEQNVIAILPPEKTPGNCSAASNCYEVDAQELFIRVSRVVDRILDKATARRVGLRFSTQMHGFLFASPDGYPLTPYISWQDTRCLSPWQSETGMDRLSRVITPERMARCGVDLKPGLPLANAYTLLGRGDYDIPKRSAFCTLGSYLGMRLSGESGSHITNAAATGLCNVQVGCWDQELIELAGMNGMLFPELLHENHPVASFKRSQKEVLLYPDVGDQQTAVLGCLLEPEVDVNLNVATAGQLARISNVLCPGEYEARPFFAGRTLNTVTRLPAGRNIDVLANLIADVGKTIFSLDCDRGSIYPRLNGLSGERGDEGLTVNLGFFKDMLDGTPGAICGVTEKNLTITNLYGTALNSMAQSYARHLVKLTGTSQPRRMVLTGGFAQKEPRLLELVSAATGLPAVCSPYLDDVIAGHFRLMLMDQGICKTLDQTSDEMLMRFPREERRK